MFVYSLTFLFLFCNRCLCLLIHYYNRKSTNTSNLLYFILSTSVQPGNLFGNYKQMTTQNLTLIQIMTTGVMQYVILS